MWFFKANHNLCVKKIFRKKRKKEEDYQILKYLFIQTDLSIKFETFKIIKIM